MAQQINSIVKRIVPALVLLFATSSWAQDTSAPKSPAKAEPARSKAVPAAPIRKANATAIRKLIPALQIVPRTTTTKQSSATIQLRPGAAPATVASADLETSHDQQVVLPITNDAGESTTLHTFCLSKSGDILAGCGTPGAGHIRVFNSTGKYLRTWPLPVVPEAINVDPEGNVVVAGEGTLLKLSSDGKTLLSKEAPHVKAMLEGRAQLREQIIQQHKSRAGAYERTLKIYDDQIARLEKKIEDGDELTAVEQQRLTVYKRSREAMATMVERQKLEGAKGLSDEQIDAQVKARLASKSKVSSISSTGDSIFIACGMSTSYGYQVFRMDGAFENATSIVKDLRGCCGQMDVQVNQSGVFVAENSRHRVAHFDHKGEPVGNWGKRDRTGENGFTSCCNPMNVCFGPNNTVLTAESNTGLIKQFSSDGELMSCLAKVTLVPGCKKVSIAISSDGKRVYMMDITRRHIVMLTQGDKSEKPAPIKSAASAKSTSTGE